MNYRTARLCPLAFIATSLAFAQPGQPATAASATLMISGDIPATLTIKAEELASMPRASAPVNEPDGSKVIYEGVLLREVLSKAGAPFGKQLRGANMASYVIAKARDGYQVVFTLAELDPQFGDEKILVVDRRDGKPLSGNQGPLRIFCAGDKEGARSVRMLESLEVVRLQKK